MMKKYKIAVLIESCLILILAAVLAVTFFSKEKSEIHIEPEEETAETVETVEASIYDSFTAREIEQMRYSKLAWFSLTTDFDPSQQPKTAIGDELVIPYKLTNMTDRELTVNIMAGQDSYEQVASLVSKVTDHPVATGDIHEYTFKPHETLVLNSRLKVSSEALVEGGSYILCSFVMVEVLNEEMNQEIKELNSNYFGISMDKMYLYAE